MLYKFRKKLFIVNSFSIHWIIEQLPAGPDCLPAAITDDNFGECLFYVHFGEHCGTNVLVLGHDRHLDLCSLIREYCQLVL